MQHIDLTSFDDKKQKIILDRMQILADTIRIHTVSDQSDSVLFLTMHTCRKLAEHFTKDYLLENTDRANAVLHAKYLYDELYKKTFSSSQIIQHEAAELKESVHHFSHMAASLLQAIKDFHSRLSAVKDLPPPEKTLADLDAILNGNPLPPSNAPIITAPAPEAAPAMASALTPTHFFSMSPATRTKTTHEASINKSDSGYSADDEAEDNKQPSQRFAQ